MIGVGPKGLRAKRMVEAEHLFGMVNLKVIPRTTEPLVRLMECLKIGVIKNRMAMPKITYRSAKGCNRMDRLVLGMTCGNTNTTNLAYQPLGYVRETDQGNLLVNDDVEGGGFEIGNALFQKFIFSSMISLDTVENSKKALSSLESALEGVSDARAIGAASLSRIEKEIEGNENLTLETEKSLSRIEDVDMAITASRLARTEIKMNSTTAIFAQANKLFNQRNYVEDLLS